MTLSSTDVTGRRLAVTRFREGYRREEIDQYLSQVVATLQAWEQAGRSGRAPARTAGLLRANDILNVEFKATKFGQGYEQDDVDELLDEVVEALREWESTAGGAAAPDSAS